MIQLPDWPGPNGITFRHIDRGFIQRGSSSLRIERAGTRFAVEVTYPPMRSTEAAVFASRLECAKREGLKLEIPLLDTPQGSPGSPVVDGAGQSGTTINLRNITPGYPAREGYWLTITNAAGQGFLHKVAAPSRADGSGDIAVNLTAPLREPFADGDGVNFANPTIEGFVEDEWSYGFGVERLASLSVTVEEYR